MFPTYHLLSSLALHLLTTRVYASQDINCSPNLVDSRALGFYNIPPFDGPPSNRTVSSQWTISTDIWENGMSIDQIFYIDTQEDDIVNNPDPPLHGCAIAIRSLPDEVENAGRSVYDGDDCLGLLDQACVAQIISAANLSVLSHVREGSKDWDCTDALATVAPECKKYVAGTGNKWLTSQSGDLFNLTHTSNNNQTCQSPSGNGNAFLEIVHDSNTTSLNATANNITPILLAAWSKDPRLWVDTQLVCISSNEAGPFNPSSTSWSTKLLVGNVPLMGTLGFVAMLFGIFT